MKSRSIRCRKAAGLLLLSLLTAGCSAAAPRSEGTCLSCDDHRLVRIVPMEEQAVSGRSRRFDHPLSLETKQWETVLRSVQVRSIHRPLLGPSYHGATESAFTDEEVLYLGAALQRAFQEATAQQRVLFALARTSDAGLSQLTSGAWFAEQGRIHLQLANYRVTVTCRRYGSRSGTIRCLRRPELSTSRCPVITRKWYRRRREGAIRFDRSRPNSPLSTAPRPVLPRRLPPSLPRRWKIDWDSSSASMSRG